MLESKKFKVLSHLKKQKSITPVDAYKLYGTMRLGAIIFKLREEYEIATHIIEVADRFGNPVRYAKYVYKRPIQKTQHQVNL